MPFTAGILLTTSLASAQGLSKEAKIERLLELTSGHATMNQVFEQMKAAMAPAIPASATPEASGINEEPDELGKDAARLVKAYSETFTKDEIN